MTANNQYLEPYYEVAYKIDRKYVDLIRNTNCPPVFNGIIQKKYMFEQVRHVNERNWWIEEFFELWFNSYTKESLENWLKQSRDFRINLNDAMTYYVQNNYLFPDEQSVLIYLYADLRRIARRVKRRLVHKK